MTARKTDPVNFIPLPIIFLDKKFSISSWNMAAEKKLLLKEKQSVGQPITDLFHASELIKLLKTQLKTSLPESLSITYNNMDFSLSLLNDVGHGYLLIVEDTTKIRHLERMRQDFVANVSHELRTPLTVLYGYLEILLEKTDLGLIPYKKILEQMFQQSARMQSLIEDLLLLSHIENDLHAQERFQEINIFPLLEKICEDAKALSGKRQHCITLNADKKLKIYGLQNELISVFSNLIFNAVNYTPAGGKITVSWQKNSHYACFEVSDTGIGIAAEHIPRITERFYRVDKARSRTSGGTGLGLAIVKHVLLLHKANLKVKSQINKGSTFTCVFPLGTQTVF